MVFFGPLKGLLDAFTNTSKSNLREPKLNPEGGNFFAQPGTTIDGKKIRNMKQLSGKKATLIVNVASK